jgi:transcriptional regulator with XRE-family HTH domain
VKTKKNKEPNQIDVLVGTRIRTQRLIREMSQTDLGDHLGVSFQQVQKYEKGKNRVGASRLQTIAKVLDVPVSFFFAEDNASRHANEENTDAVFNLLNTSRTIKLVKDFSRIKDPALQQSIVSLVEKVANKT